MAARAGKIRVLVVDADASVRTALARRLAQHPFVDVLGAAANAQTALPKISSFRPDWVVVDLTHDPRDALGMLEVLHDARSETRRAVVADLGASAGAQLVADLRRLGVAAVVPRGPSVDAAAVDRLGGELLQPILRAAGARAKEAPPAPPPAVAPARRSGDQPAGPAARPAAARGASAPVRVPAGVGLVRVCGIGVSTGGPVALNQLLPRLPASFPVPIVVVQHMPPKFTASLARSLDQACALEVVEANGGEEMRPGRVLIAPGGRHLRVARSGGRVVAEVTDDVPVCSCRPSVDYLFRSLADCYGRSALGVLLTGMGEDGWLGSRAIHEVGGRLLAQDQTTCAVYGMPRGPIEAGIAPALPLDEIAQAIANYAGGLPCV